MKPDICKNCEENKPDCTCKNCREGFKSDCLCKNDTLNINNSHGGKRPNSGRKKLTDTKTISFRVPKNKAKDCTDYIRPLLKSFLSL